MRCSANTCSVEHLGEELADVFLYLVRLADVCSVVWCGNNGGELLCRCRKVEYFTVVRKGVVLYSIFDSDAFDPFDISTDVTPEVRRGKFCVTFL